MYTSFYLSGGMIFPMEGNSECADAPWFIGFRNERGEHGYIGKYRGLPKRYPTFESAQKELNEYARKRGLKPAY